MKEQDHQTEQEGDATRSKPRRVRLPGFLIENEVGLGDVIKRATNAIGMTPCGGCERRATSLNRWMSFYR
jgi:hypothetical protein